MKNRLSHLLLVPMFAACSATPDSGGILSHYRIDVRQGNYVSQEMVAQLKPGLTRDQVRFILGSPLVTDIFHADRWDYIYRFKPGKSAAQERRLTVFFENNLLARVAGDVAPVQGTGGTEASVRPATRVIEIPGSAPTEPAKDNPEGASQ